MAKNYLYDDNVRKNVIVYKKMICYICPKCGKKTMMKQQLTSGKYRLACSVCGFQGPIQTVNEKKIGYV